MINDGKLREEDLLNIGKSGLSGGLQGLVLGTITASITTYAEMGVLGDSLKALSMSEKFCSCCFYHCSICCTSYL